MFTAQKLYVHLLKWSKVLTMAIKKTGGKGTQVQKVAHLFTNPLKFGS